jgi:predicted flap endonuclease-1-like 5' DNA nuclease
MTRVIDIEGISPKFAEMLEAAGVKTTESLLETAGSAKGRKELAIKAHIDEHKLLEWVNRADLMRIKGVGSEFSDLLEAAGVDTVKELATRRADNLHAKLLEVNEAKKLVRRTPTAGEVDAWIADAKTLPQAMTAGSRKTERSINKEGGELPYPGNGSRVSETLEGSISGLLWEAAQVFGSEEAAQAWLETPNRSIGGVPPRRLVEKGPEGVREAALILFRLKHGIYS